MIVRSVPKPNLESIGRRPWWTEVTGKIRNGRCQKEVKDKMERRWNKNQSLTSVHSAEVVKDIWGKFTRGQEVCGTLRSTKLSTALILASRGSGNIQNACATFVGMNAFLGLRKSGVGNTMSLNQYLGTLVIGFFFWHGWAHASTKESLASKNTLSW